ncbi:MAG: GtrA family protein [Sarcina sp.]
MGNLEKLNVVKENSKVTELNLKNDLILNIKNEKLKDLKELKTNVKLGDLILEKISKGKELLTFMFVGAVNTSLEILTLNILWWITGIYSGNANYIFKLIALGICSVVGYFMNKKLTFKSNNDDKAYFKYALIFGILSFIEAIMIAELTKIQVSAISIVLWANLVSFFASATTGIANFIITKFFVFKKQ